MSHDCTHFEIPNEHKRLQVLIINKWLTRKIASPVLYYFVRSGIFRRTKYFYPRRAINRTLVVIIKFNERFGNLFF